MTSPQPLNAPVEWLLSESRKGGGLLSVVHSYFDSTNSILACHTSGTFRQPSLPPVQQIGKGFMERIGKLKKKPKNARAKTLRTSGTCFMTVRRGPATQCSSAAPALLPGTSDILRNQRLGRKKVQMTCARKERASLCLS